MNDKTSFLSLSITKVRKKMCDRLLSDLQLSNAPFREDDETTLVWKEFCNLHCTKWLNDFWQPVINHLQKKPHIVNSINDTVDFIVQYVLYKFYSEYNCVPIMIKEILQDLIKTIATFFKGKKSEFKKMKSVVLINVIFLRLICPWLLQMATSFLGFTPSGALLGAVAIVSKVLFQLISQAINHQSALNLDPYVKSTAVVHRYPLKIVLNKITKIQTLTPFDPRRHLGAKLDKATTCGVKTSVEKSKFPFWLTNHSGSDTKVPKLPTANNSTQKFTIQHWDTHKIQEFLFEHGLYESIESFRRFKVDGSSFLLLNDHTLRNKLGIMRVAHRKRILKLVQESKPAHTSPPNSPKKDKDVVKHS